MIRTEKSRLIAGVCLAALIAFRHVGLAQEAVIVSLPHAITFRVSNVSVVTTADPGRMTLSFQNAKLGAGKVLRISVRARAANLSSRSRGRLPITSSKISWTATATSGGFGFSGDLRDSSYSLVYQSAANPNAGGVDLAWRLNPPGSSIRAGLHTVEVEWKIESAAP